MVRSMLAFAATAFYVFATWITDQGAPCYGRPVPDRIAGQIRGGMCGSGVTTNCPAPGKSGCTACTKVVTGITKGPLSGTCYCASDCGSWTAQIGSSNCGS